MRFSRFHSVTRARWLAAGLLALLALPAADIVGAQQQTGRRDPFQPLVRQGQGGGPPRRLPPGKPGLVISTLRIDGIVSAPNGMIAVVSNPEQRVYFLREGDQLYDGSVTGISMETVTFREVGRDPFGRPVDRTVVKRLYPSAGEQ